MELKALVFDLFYNKYNGIIIYVRIFKGKLNLKQKIKFFKNNEKKYQVEKIGVKTPKEILKNELITGEIGWFSANIKNIKEIKIGDTVMDFDSLEKPLEGYEEIKPNVFSNLYPENSEQYKNFCKSLEELHIQDSSLVLEKIDSNLLGLGFRCGFLGLLHREIICERLKKEYNQEIIITSPNINYKIFFFNGKVLETNNPQKINFYDRIKKIEELFISININVQEKYLEKIFELCKKKRGIYQFKNWKMDSLYVVNYHLPFSEFILDFHDKIKSISNGYASFDYKKVDFRESDIEKVDIALNGQIISDLSFFAHKYSSYKRSKDICQNLKKTLNKQNFSLSIQAIINNKIIVRETLTALSKNVTGNLYGGDRTRKMKLWAKQKKGKSKMKESGRVNFGVDNLKQLLKNNK